MTPRIMTADGAIACAKLREAAPMVRKTIDIDKVTSNDIKIKKKNDPTSRRKCVMKYKGILNVNVLSIL